MLATYSTSRQSVSAKGHSRVSLSEVISSPLRQYRIYAIESQRLCDTKRHHDCDMETIGERVRRLRKARGLTQIQFATLAGIAQSTISGIEKGERQIQPASLIEMAHILRTEAYYLKYGVGISDLDGDRSDDVREIVQAFPLLDASVKEIWLSSARAALKKADDKKRNAA